jgi:hypothetical protein
MMLSILISPHLAIEAAEGATGLAPAIPFPFVQGYSISPGGHAFGIELGTFRNPRLGGLRGVQSHQDRFTLPGFMGHNGAGDGAGAHLSYADQ